MTFAIDLKPIDLNLWQQRSEQDVCGIATPESHRLSVTKFDMQASGYGQIHRTLAFLPTLKTLCQPRFADFIVEAWTHVVTQRQEYGQPSSGREHPAPQFDLLYPRRSP